MVKNLLAMQETCGLIPGEGNGNPLQYSCLENFMDRGDFMGLQSRIRLSTQLAHINKSIPERQGLTETKELLPVRTHTQSAQPGATHPATPHVHSIEPGIRSLPKAALPIWFSNAFPNTPCLATSPTPPHLPLKIFPDSAPKSAPNMELNLFFMLRSNQYLFSTHPRSTWNTILQPPPHPLP